MKQALKKIVEEKGLDILKNHEELVSCMTAEGIAPSEAYSLLLALTTCPSVVSFANKEILPEQENSLVDALSRNAGISVSKARDLTDIILYSIDTKRDRKLQYRFGGVTDLSIGNQNLRTKLLSGWESSFFDKVSYNFVANQPMEGEILEHFTKALEYRDLLRIPKTAIDDLIMLAMSGNGEACYKLGMKYLNLRDDKTLKSAVECFKCAAGLGYAPAYGALANIELSKGGNMVLISELLSYPGAIAGENGARWAKNLDYMLMYREANKKKTQIALLMSVVVLLLSFFMFIIGKGFFAALAIVLSLACTVGAILTILQRAYYRSMVPLGLAMLACWLMLTINIAFI